MSLSPSLQYIFIHCGKNNICHNDPEVNSDGLINLARVVKKKYKDIKSLLVLFCQGTKPTHKNIPLFLLQIFI